MHSDTQVPNTHNHGSLSFSQGMFAIGEHKTIFSRIRAASFRRWCFLLLQYGYLHNGLQSFSQGPECGLWIFLDIIPCTNFLYLTYCKTVLSEYILRKWIILANILGMGIQHLSLNRDGPDLVAVFINRPYSCALYFEHQPVALYLELYNIRSAQSLNDCLIRPSHYCSQWRQFYF